MKGSITYMKDRGYFAVDWYNPKTRRTEKLYRDHRGGRMYHRTQAEKLLALMQADVERGIFRLERYTHELPTDTVPYLWEWLAAVSPTLKPATVKDYGNSIKNYLAPFFEKHRVQLAEIQLDTITQLMNDIDRGGKGKLNVIYCLHACLDYAWRSNRIPMVPPFPKRREYKIAQPIIRWLPEERQEKILEAIPAEHQPIFWWLKYHYRRPGEAMALHREDFVDGVFLIHRTFSARKLTDSTKTGEVHRIPCHSEFERFFDQVVDNYKKSGILSRYFFVNPSGRLTGKPYTHCVMSLIWKEACRESGENISMYQGLKHSSCSQFLTEKGGTLSELQEITDHARMESVRRYAKTEVMRRKGLMERRLLHARSCHVQNGPT